MTKLELWSSTLLTASEGLAELSALRSLHFGYMEISVAWLRSMQTSLTGLTQLILDSCNVNIDEGLNPINTLR